MSENKEGAYDFSVTKGRLQYTENIETIKQRITYAFVTLYGEWFLDYGKGFPWYQIVFIKDYDSGQIQDQITSTILGVDGVIELLEIPTLSVDNKTRSATISISVRTTSGTITDQFGVNNV